MAEEYEGLLSEDALLMLSDAESKILSALTIAGDTCASLTKLDAEELDVLQGNAKNYMLLCQEVKSTLNDILVYVNENYRLNVSCYGAQKDLEIEAMRTKLLKELIQKMRNDLDK